MNISRSSYKYVGKKKKNNVHETKTNNIKR